MRFNMSMNIEGACVPTLLGIIGASLTIKFALETAFLLLAGLQLITEGEQTSFSFLRHNCDGRRPQIKAHNSRSALMLWLLVREPSKTSCAQ